MESFAPLGKLITVGAQVINIWIKASPVLNSQSVSHIAPYKDNHIVNEAINKMLTSRCIAKLVAHFTWLFLVIPSDRSWAHPNTAQWRWICEGLTWFKTTCLAVVIYCCVTSDPTYWLKRTDIYYLIVFMGKKSRSSLAMGQPGLQPSEHCLDLLLGSFSSLLSGFSLTCLPPELGIQEREPTKIETTVSLQLHLGSDIPSFMWYSIPLVQCGRWLYKDVNTWRRWPSGAV